MSIENSAIHYIKDTMFGDFYLNNPLENKPLGRIFCQMVEFKSLENITYLSPTSVFMQDMLEAFVEFDKNLNPPGLITKQFTALAQKCKEKGVKLLIGKDYRNNNIGVDRTKLHQDNVFINFNENMVKNMMKNPIYVIQQKGNNIPEIKAIPLGNLVAGTMVTDFDNPALIAKCAAYLLFHELFHVNTFIEFSQWKSSEPGNTDNEDVEYVSNHDIIGFSSEDVKELLNNTPGGDDFRNVVGVTKFGEIRVPGEYELLQALYPNKKIMRLYEGKLLNFSNSKVLEAAVKVARFENDCLNSKSDLQQNLNNRYLSWELEKILNDKKIQFNKIELNDVWIQASFEDGYNKLANINTQLKSYIQMEATKIKVDTSVWEAQANLYIENKRPAKVGHKKVCYVA